MYFYIRLYCAFYKFLEVQIMQNYIGKKGRRFQLHVHVPLVFGCIPSGSGCGNVPNELVHRAGPPFLDNHYRGQITILSKKICRGLLFSGSGTTFHCDTQVRKLKALKPVIAIVSQGTPLMTTISLCQLLHNTTRQTMFI